MKADLLHKELKEALKASYDTISAWAAQLQKPDGTNGVSHTAVIQATQDPQGTPWIREAARQKIRQAKRDYPKFYKKLHESATGA
jgi:hypothetical protein